MECFGRNLSDHCCYIAGRACPFLEENTEKDYKWSCQLRRENDSWDAVIVDSRYDTGEGSPGHAFKNTPYTNCKTYQCKECVDLEAGTITQEEFNTLKAK